MKASTETAIRRVINLLLFWTGCVLLGTGLMLEFRLQKGRHGGHGQTILDLSRHEWGEVHLWSGYIITILLVLHLWLARKWIVNIAARRRKMVVSATLLVGLSIVVGFLSLPIRQG